MKHFEIEIKERGRKTTLKTSFVGDKTREEVIEFFGLNEPDVEWFEIKEK